MGEDEAATVRAITASREVFGSLVNHYRGRVVDSPGDNILAEFPSVVDAVQCAVEIQQVFKARNAQLPKERRMMFRIGVNLGDVIDDDGRLYGSGVNIAARLEALAEPGGICISGTVYEHIKNRLTLWNEYLGEHEVKNIVDPIKVYRIHLEPEAKIETGVVKKAQIAPWQRAVQAFIAILVVGVGAFAVWSATLRTPEDRVEELTEQGSAPPVSEKPSIAVLPFDNMSDDPEQAYFSDGITEDLITDLSKISGLFVIARNSTFVYKGQAVDIQEVGRDLGVSYILEGSVRKANGAVRITAQLIDVATGGHLWAERYDRGLVDIFSVQDEVVGQIVAALAVELTEDEQVRVVQDVTDNLEAYDYVKRGWWYKNQLTKEDNDQARQMFQMAIELDPQFVSAYIGLGFTYYEAWSQQWTQDPQSLDRAYELAQEAITLDASNSGAHALLGWVYLWRRQFDLAIAHKEQAIALNPNNGDHYNDLAQVLIFAGEAEEAIGYAETAMRLNPHYPVQYPFALGFAYVILGRYEEAIPPLEEALAINPFFFSSHLLLAGIYADTGQDDRARNHVDEALKINPQISIEVYRESLPFRDPESIADIYEAFRKAGFE
jgi:adenylate cyclase